jgi:hypothetical protein
MGATHNSALFGKMWLKPFGPVEKAHDFLDFHWFKKNFSHYFFEI